MRHEWHYFWNTFSGKTCFLYYRLDFNLDPNLDSNLIFNFRWMKGSCNWFGFWGFVSFSNPKFFSLYISSSLPWAHLLSRVCSILDFQIWHSKPSYLKFWPLIKNESQHLWNLKAAFPIRILEDFLIIPWSYVFFG